MANLKPVFASEATSQSTGLNSLADTSSNSSSEIDNSSNKYLDMQFNIEMAAAAANTGVCTLYLSEGAATGKTSTTVNLSNMRRIGDVQLNGTTVVRKTFFVENMPEFWKSHIINNSGGALASSANTVKYVGINYENV